MCQWCVLTLLQRQNLRLSSEQLDVLLALRDKVILRFFHNCEEVLCQEPDVDACLQTLNRLFPGYDIQADVLVSTASTA